MNYEYFPIDLHIADVFFHWLAGSSTLGWLIANPLWSAILLLISIFLFSGLFKAIGRGSERLWLFLLALPWILIKPVTQLFRIGFNRLVSKNIQTKIVADRGSRVQEIVTRLEQLDREQSDLISELSQLIKQLKVDN
jgi:hypothetical protein